jgi:hypothetical protein
MGNFEIELLDYEISKFEMHNQLKTHVNTSDVKAIPDEIMASHIRRNAVLRKIT